MAPRMTSVFILKEANVTSLAQMNKLPKFVAEYINGQERKWAPEVAKIVAARDREYWDRYIKDPDTYNATNIHDDSLASGLIDSYLQSREWQVTKQALEKFPSKKEEIISKVLNFIKTNTSHDGTIDGGNRQDNEFLDMMEPYRPAGTPVDQLKKRAELTFPDGFFWVKLEGHECDREGQAMQHCGRGNGDMWSLRDPEGNPHVTVDVTMEYGKEYATQIRGKQNRRPSEKYWDHVEKFFEKFGFIPDDQQIQDSPRGVEFHKSLEAAADRHHGAK